ncbi:hypothetical protein [Rhodococcus jostii]
MGGTPRVRAPSDSGLLLDDYRDFLEHLESRVRQARIRASRVVNIELPL